jgi:hypothetical protein
LLATRRLLRAFGLTALASGALLCAAAPAGAVVTTVGLREYGVEPVSTASFVAPTTPLAYEGGPVVHSSAPYAIYWDPKDGYAAWEGLTAGFLEAAGHESELGSLGNVFSVAGQYRDTTGAASAYNLNFRGAFTDVDRYPATENCAETALCLTDAQIRTELTKYITSNGLPAGLNPTTGPTPIYFIFTPPGVAVCLEGSGETGHCTKPGTGQPLCSYHSFTTVSATTVLYAVLPWTAAAECQGGTGLELPNALTSPDDNTQTPADVVPDEIADEQIATITDPLLTGWRETGGAKDEVPDKCRNEFALTEGPTNERFNQFIGARSYYINDEFDQAAIFDPYPGNPCIHEVRIQPQFTAPDTVRAGDPVTFNATESVVDLGIAKYNWEFGPGETAEVNCEGRTPTYGKTPAECNAALVGTGNPNSVASVVHKYAHSGSHEVKLTVVDDGGNSAVAYHAITVVPTQQEEAEARATREAGERATREAGERATREAGERAAREAGEKAKREAEEKAKSPAAVESAKRAAEAKAGVPVATTRVLSRSLKTALSGGLTVRYSVNEQVTGSFEVLLASSVARQIGLHGTPATGLPAGSAPQIVIAKAILVTTAGGHNTVKILFGKKTAALLHKLHKVSLMVRLVVRNASSRTPVSTTVVSVVTLH